MKPKTMILMVIAVTCGLGASYMTSRLLAERGDAPETKKVPYLVAKKDLKQGDHLKNPEEWFEIKQVPEGEEPKMAIASFEQLKDRNVIRSRRVGDFITTEDLFDPTKGYGVHVSMPEGYRGFGIRVNSETVAGGWASLPNSRVDILTAVRKSSDRDSYAQILLQDVLVLAADQKNTTEGGGAILAATVTVAVKPEDALKLAMAEISGPLRLIVRRYNDKTRPDIDKITGENVANGTTPKSGEFEDVPPTKVVAVEPTPPKTEPKTEPKAEPKVEPVVVAKVNYTKHRVTIIRGDKITYHDYTLDEEGNVIEPGTASNAEPQLPRPPQQVPQRKDEP